MKQKGRQFQSGSLENAHDNAKPRSTIVEIAVGNEILQESPRSNMKGSFVGNNTKVSQCPVVTLWTFDLHARPQMIFIYFIIDIAELCRLLSRV